jgi:hypothetical protein
MTGGARSYSLRLMVIVALPGGTRDPDRQYTSTFYFPCGYGHPSFYNIVTTPSRGPR